LQQQHEVISEKIEDLRREFAACPPLLSDTLAPVPATKPVDVSEAMDSTPEAFGQMNQSNWLKK